MENIEFKEIIDDEELIFLSKKLSTNVRNLISERKEIRVGYQGGSHLEEVCIEDDFWYSQNNEISVRSRIWNSVGQYVDGWSNQHISVEFNVGVNGTKLSGRMLKNLDTGETFIAHSGRVGGGRKGIGRYSYLANSEHFKPTIYLNRQGKLDYCFLISKIDSEELIKNLKLFEVDARSYKAKVKKGELLSTSSATQTQRLQEELVFSSEYYGLISTELKSKKVTYERTHGIIVEALHKEICKKRNVANTQLADLLVVDQNKVYCTHVYEVKTSVDRGALYTAIGQLLVYEKNYGSLAKVLVIPKDGPLPRSFLDVFEEQNVNVVRYRFNESKKNVSFFGDLIP